MSTQAQYASIPRAALAQVSVLNSNRDGQGPNVTVFTPGASGSRIDDITFVAQGTTTNGAVRLFINDGANTRLWQEVLVTATTPSTTVATWTYTISNQALILPSGYVLRATSNASEVINVIVTRAGDF